MHWETEKFVWLALLQYLPYCSGPETNPQYLRCMPVLLFSFGRLGNGGRERLKYYWVQAHTACHTTGQWMDRQDAGARNRDFIWKASRLRRWSQRTIFLESIQASFLLKGEGVTCNCKLLGPGWTPWGDVIILCFCRCPCRSSHHVPVNLQQDKCYFL